MKDVTVLMALVDFVPVALFFAAAVLLQRALYNKMVKGAFALLAAGSILVFAGGAYKALWKILYALGVCDYTLLEHSLFPMQGLGFLLVFLSLAGMFTKYNRGAVLPAVVPVYAGSLPFLIFQVLGCAGMQWCLFAVALRMRRRPAAALFVLAFVSMLCMGYLSAKFDGSAAMNWLAQGVNIVSNGALLAGVILLDRAGLARPDALARTAKA
ncbi:MAG: hypothetical protein VB021_03745 [Oscillospiraceae bacterium]|nr:hypothetical protein [Oscillospiraceae bacterium]